MNRRAINALAGLATAIFMVAGTLVMAAPATAYVPIEGAGPGQHFRHVYGHKAFRKACIKKRRHQHRSTRPCHGKIRNIAHEGRRVRMHRLSDKQLSVVGTNGETLRTALRAGPVYYRSFAQDGFGLFGPKQLYGERHEGGGFYDGENVWTERGGHEGFHTCFPTSEVGYDVTIETCSEVYQDPGGMTPYYQHWMRWNVAPIWGGLPIKFHYDVHVNLHGSGRLTYWSGDNKTGDETP